MEGPKPFQPAGTKVLSWKDRTAGGVTGQLAEHRPQVLPEAQQQPRRANIDPLASAHLHLFRVEGEGHSANARRVINRKSCRGSSAHGLPDYLPAKPPQVEASGTKENMQATRADHADSPADHNQGHCMCCSEGKTSN